MDTTETTVLTEEQIQAYLRFARILKQIHVRLISEGWKIEDGVFTKPDGTICDHRKTDNTQAKRQK